MIKRVLIILPNNLGDVLMALPVLEALKKINRENEIFFLAEEGFEGGIENSFYCKEILKFPRKKIRDSYRVSNWTSGLSELEDFVNDITNRKIDEVINLSQHPYVAYLVSLLKDTTVKGRFFLREGNHAIPDSWSQYLYAIPFSRRYNHLHATDIYKRIAGAVIVTEDRIHITDEETDIIHRFVYDNAIDIKSRIAVFQPGAAYKTKRWPIENFIQLGNKLIEDGMFIIITGSASELDIICRIKEKLGERCFVCAGKLTFRETIVLLSFCDICITGDTAIMHAASAVKKKVFALFGPTSPIETGPYGKGHLIFAGRCDNRPCFCFECNKNECMNSITPEIVYSFIQEKPSKNAVCDVYETEIDESGTFSLKVICGQCTYFDKTGSSLTRKLFEKSYKVMSTEKELDNVKKECLEFIAGLDISIVELNNYLLSRDIDFIKKFENNKLEIGKLKGISSFLSAILNIRLNSISVIEPISAVTKSVLVSNNFRKEIMDLFNR